MSIEGSILMFRGEDTEVSFQLREEVVSYLKAEQLEVLSFGLGSIESKVGFKTQVELFQGTLKATL